MELWLATRQPDPIPERKETRSTIVERPTTAQQACPTMTRSTWQPLRRLPAKEVQSARRSALRHSPTSHPRSVSRYQEEPPRTKSAAILEVHHDVPRRSSKEKGPWEGKIEMGPCDVIDGPISKKMGPSLTHFSREWAHLSSLLYSFTHNSNTKVHSVSA